MYVLQITHVQITHVRNMAAARLTTWRVAHVRTIDDMKKGLWQESLELVGT